MGFMVGRLSLSLTTALTVAALQSAGAQTAASPAPTADSLIAAAKAATGGAAWDKVDGWHERGKLSAGGLSGTYEAWNGFPHLEQAQTFDLGPSSGSQGWDGKSAWTTDSSKQVRVEAGGEAVAAAIQSAYLGTYAFFYPDRWPRTQEYAGKRTADGVTYDAVKITPKDAEPVEIWFDGATHTIEREVQLTGAQPQTYLFSRYTQTGGVTVPFETITRVGDDPKFDQVSVVDTIDVSAPIPQSRFAPPPPPAYDAQFPAGKTSVTVAFKLHNNHIYIPASIDGKPPIPFVFDTGATNFFDNAHAKALGVAIEGSLPGGGFGSAISSTGLAKVKSVSIGGLTLPDQVFASDDSSTWITVEGADSAGLLGYEFAKRAVITIDYAHRKMTFTRPDAFHPPAGVTPIPFKFDAHIPMVEGSIDGASGEFEIDTGARSALTLMHPFADANNLVAKYKATHSATTGYGIGGPSRALLARGGALTVGPVTIEKPVVDLVSDDKGAAASARTAGNIGGDLLKRFTVTLDYGHQLMWLQPNAMAKEPDVFDRAGLWIMRAKDGNIAVADVSSDSAATAAGIETGDEIVSVDGKKASGIEIYDLRETFKQKPGTKITLEIKGKNGMRKAELTLADQV